MSEKTTVILNSLVSAVLIVVLSAAIYQFIQTEHLSRDVSSINRNMQRAQQQITELKEVASSTFEQTMRRFDDFSRQLGGIAPASKRSSTVVAAAPQAKPATKGSKISASRQPARPPKDPRKAQEVKLARDRQQFLEMRAHACEMHTTGKTANGSTAKAKTGRCEERTRLLAAGGNSAAQKWLGQDAQDKRHDLQMAIFWFEQAANQGDTDAMDSLGFIYAGNMRPADSTVADALIDPMKTLYWYGKSASLGDANAMGAIAGIYQKGQLAPQNPHEAILWYEFASNATVSAIKSRKASTNFAGVLGDIYYNGAGVDPDKLQAYEWYSIACADATRLRIKGDSSCASRKNVGNELSPVETAKAQALAAEWRKLHR